MPTRYWKRESGNSPSGATPTRAGRSSLRSPDILPPIHRPNAQRCRQRTSPGVLCGAGNSTKASRRHDAHRRLPSDHSPGAASGGRRAGRVFPSPIETRPDQLTADDSHRSTGPDERTRPLHLIAVNG